MRTAILALRTAVLAALLIAGLPSRGAGKAAPALSESPFVREAKTVTVNGDTEEWRLVWGEKPAPVCSARDYVMSITCPCDGVAYGEYGHLSLQRVKNGKLIDHLPLGPLYGGLDGPGDVPKGMVALKKKAFDYSNDFELGEASLTKLITAVDSRPDVRIMRFADYDHDGIASEFLLQVGTLPCGKLHSVAVGISRANSRLHALGTAEHPDRPLVMPNWAWAALLKQQRPQRVVTWECDDHGSEVHTELELAASDGKIEAKELTFACPFNPKRSKPNEVERL